MVVKGGRPLRLSSRKSPSSVVILTLLLMFSVIILLLLSLRILSMPSNSGRSHKANDLISIARKTTEMRNDGHGKDDQCTEVISWEPRAFVYHNFLSKEEFEFLINLSKPRMKKSTVVDSKIGKSVDSRVRIGSGTFLTRGGDQIIRYVEKRITDFSFIPVVFTP